MSCWRSACRLIAPPDRSRFPARFVAARSNGRLTNGFPPSNAIGAASSRILAAHRRHQPKATARLPQMIRSDRSARSHDTPALALFPYLASSPLSAERVGRRILRAPPSFSHRRTSVPPRSNGKDSHATAAIDGRRDETSITLAGLLRTRRGVAKATASRRTNHQPAGAADTETANSADVMDQRKTSDRSV